jgi:peptidoglycan/LPS O-acetylase OafA/YrhL
MERTKEFSSIELQDEEQNSHSLPLHETEHAIPEHHDTVWVRRKSRVYKAATLLKSSPQALSTILRTLTPSPLLLYLGYPSIQQKSHLNTSYLDGLRGIASVCVYIEHFLLPYQPSLFSAGANPNIYTSIFQLPILRSFYSGSLMVAIFFVVSGFSLAHKPLTLRHQKSFQPAADALISSSFRRGIRLLLPSVIGVVVTMLAVQLGFFENEYPTLPSEHYNIALPKKLPSFCAQIIDCARFILTRILYPKSWLRPVPHTPPTEEYGSHLWTVSTEFWSSQILFIGMLSLVKTQRVFHISAAVVIVVYNMWCMRWDVGLYFAGMVLADFDIARNRQKPDFMGKGLRMLQEIYLCIFFLSGLYVGTVPDFGGTSIPGFQSLVWVMAETRYWQSIGAVVIVWAVANSRLLQPIFSSTRMQYLGQISFALYLAHFPVLSSYGWAIVPAVWEFTGSDTALRYNAGVVVGFVLLTPIMLWVADIFWRLVDMPCSDLARRLESKVSCRE